MIPCPLHRWLLNHVYMILKVDRLSVIPFFLSVITSNLLTLVTCHWKPKMDGVFLKGLHSKSRWLSIFHQTKPVHQQARFLLLYFSMFFFSYYYFFNSRSTLKDTIENTMKPLFIARAFWMNSYNKCSTWTQI